jgi:predicted secreted protein
VEIDARFNGETVRVRLGDEILLTLSETPTTGFRWKLIADGAPACVLIGDTARPSAAPGGPAARDWRFRAANPGSAHIELVLVRSWEGPSSASRTFVVDIAVG